MQEIGEINITSSCTWANFDEIDNGFVLQRPQSRVCVCMCVDVIEKAEPKLKPCG